VATSAYRARSAAIAGAPVRPATPQPALVVRSPMARSGAARAAKSARMEPACSTTSASVSSATRRPTIAPWAPAARVACAPVPVPSTPTPVEIAASTSRRTGPTAAAAASPASARLQRGSLQLPRRANVQQRCLPLNDGQACTPGGDAVHERLQPMVHRPRRRWFW
jgi:hypothetical protein